MKSRACKPPALGQDAAPTSTAVQQSLPLEPVGHELARSNAHSGSRLPVRNAAQHLWFCIWLPRLPLEAVASADDADTPLAVVEEQHGIHRVLMADAAARDT